MATPCKLYISRMSDADAVKIEARQGAQLLCRIEVDMTEFAKALMGLAAQPATFTTKRGE